MDQRSTENSRTVQEITHYFRTINSRDVIVTAREGNPKHFKDFERLTRFTEVVRFLTIVKFDPEAFRMFPYNFEKSKCRKFPQATRKSANICIADTKDGLQPEEIRFFHSRKNKEIYVLSEQFFLLAHT